ncbi:Npun_F5749 family FMN-dependent PPOX-type flavoprotein [Microseira wollei]|uniref:Pyridoxamine 5'-phosphate oxidase-related, FMN-binding protein n=1 Tax=Microseira wollei NIES-4236 TaxID=2530354 RepID=A0AAV3X211_9CYAN|nr:Npun_F5749 family FMN-dependent PPOX-type flavoprotein [Microseira wollei]GET35278.1 pyridoxamine 5'-phosphate oxidase-related, FMN-binding protein [Microseira wollei NIES-4236]
MTLAPWRSPLSRALDLNRSLVYARYLQLATVRADGRPANRTIVFRGFLADTNQLAFVTDSRSQKADQIDDQSWGEACWYFLETREQFRLAGQLILVRENNANTDLQKARQSAWQELSDAARLQFAWPHPGQNRANSEAFEPPPPNPTEPLLNFCLLLLDPVQVDHLELRGEPQNRWLYQLDSAGVWLTQEINP